MADPGFVERGGWDPSKGRVLDQGGCSICMYPLPRKARKLSATTYIRDQWIMDANREIYIEFDSVQCISNNDEAMN